MSFLSLASRTRRQSLLAALSLGLACGASQAQAPRPPAHEVPLPPWVTPPETVVVPPDSASLSGNGLRAAWTTADQKSVLTATRVSPDAPWSAPDRILTTRGLVHQIVFSPNGESIVYENERSWKGSGAPNDTWEFICVYDFATGQISYIDPSFDFDTDPSWSSDGTAITFTRKVEGMADAHLIRPVTRLKLGAWKPPALRPGERFTMASVIAAPFVYPPAPSADGTALAYVTREARDRNVYFLRAGQPARLLTKYAGDDGQDMSELPAVSRNGAAVAYVHGGSINKQGDAPNPTAMSDMPQQQVWIIGTKGDAPRLLGSGNGVVFTPDDQFVLWRSQGNVMGAALTWKNGLLLGVGSPRQFLTGRREAMRFSPDGSKLAYQRGDGVEVYDFATKTATVIPHGNDVDIGPVWSPDGTHLAFRREPADAKDQVRNECGGERYCGEMVASQPWAIWTVGMSDLLHPKPIWQAKPGIGSVFYPMDQSYSPGTHGDQLLWSAKDQIVFCWEGDGWRHLYAVPTIGGEAKLLTPGDGEVETAALTLDGKSVIYATNIGDLGRRHISQVRLDGSPATSITGGERDQWSPIPLAGGKIAFVDASWADPPTVVLRDANGKTKISEFPRTPLGFPSALLLKPQLVDFPASDGHTAYGQLFVPPHPTGCAIIFAHGGIRRQMLPSFHYMDAYAYLYEMNQYLASRGCVVLSVEYRSSIMRGEAFRDAPGWGFSGNSELLDFVGAAQWLKTRKDVDASRGIGIYGLSWGGYMTAELLAQHSDLFSVGFDMAGVHDAADPDYFQYSALSHIDTWTSPVFLAQGDDDMNVDFNNGLALARALQTKRPAVELKQQVLPGQTHDLYLTYEQLVEIYQSGSDWLLSHMEGK